MGRDQGRVKRTGRDEPIGFVIHICMERAQGISLCSYLCLKLAKMSFFSMFYIFSSTKLDSRREEQVLPRVVGTNGRGEVVGKGVGG
jgi:hypothetical protein